MRRLTLVLATALVVCALSAPGARAEDPRAAAAAAIAGWRDIILDRPATRDEGSSRAHLRAHGLVVLANVSDPAAAKALDEYEQRVALADESYSPPPPGGIPLIGFTVDAALIEATSPKIYPLQERALRVLKRALDRKAVFTERLARAACQPGGKASYPVSIAIQTLCTDGIHAEERWAKEAGQQSRYILFGAATAAALGAVGASIATRQDDRVLPVMTLTLGGVTGAVALASAAGTCHGPMCGLASLAEVSAGLLGGLLGLFGGVLTTSAQGASRVVVTSIGAAAVIGAAAHHAWGDSD